MISMTYGVMPSPDTFSAAFDREVDGLRYRVGNDRLLGTDDFSCSQLYAIVQDCANVFTGAADCPADLVSVLRVSSEDDEFTDEEREQYGDLGSAILSTLGFEWI